MLGSLKKWWRDSDLLKVYLGGFGRQFPKSNGKYRWWVSFYFDPEQCFIGVRKHFDSWAPWDGWVLSVCLVPMLVIRITAEWLWHPNDVDGGPFEDEDEEKDEPSNERLHEAAALYQSELASGQLIVR